MDLRLIIGLAGSALLVAGVADRNVAHKNTLFAIGSACMFVYALLGYLAGGPIFFVILQTYIALSTLCMIFNVPDNYDTPILAMGGVLLIGWSLTRFQGLSTGIFVVGLVLIGIGFALDPGTTRRDVFLMTGSAVIAVFSVLMRDWIFVGLNAIFAGLSLVNVVRDVRMHSKQTTGLRSAKS